MSAVSRPSGLQPPPLTAELGLPSLSESLATRPRWARGPPPGACPSIRCNARRRRDVHTAPSRPRSATSVRFLPGRPWPVDGADLRPVIPAEQPPPENRYGEGGVRSPEPWRRRSPGAARPRPASCFLPSGRWPHQVGGSEVIRPTGGKRNAGSSFPTRNLCHLETGTRGQATPARHGLTGPRPGRPAWDRCLTH